MTAMDKRDLALLERIFEDDVNAALGVNNSLGLPTQIKGKRIQKLADEGYVERAVVTLGGRFPMTVEGWRLTTLGHATYCFSCDGDEP